MKFNVTVSLQNFSKKPSKKEFMNRPIITPDQINVREYDIIIVATIL